MRSTYIVGIHRIQSTAGAIDAAATRLVLMLHLLLIQVTRERVRQVETKALLKLRQPTRSDGLKEYTRANTAQLTWGQSGALGKKSS